MRKVWMSSRRSGWLRRFRQFFSWGQDTAKQGRRIFSDFSGNFRRGFSGSATRGALLHSQRMVHAEQLGLRRAMSLKTSVSGMAHRLTLSRPATSPQGGPFGPESGIERKGKSLRLGQGSGQPTRPRQLMAAPRPYPRARLNLFDPVQSHEPRPNFEQEQLARSRKPFTLSKSTHPAWDALLAEYVDYAWTRRLI